MLFRDYKEAYVKFCEEEIIREIALARRRYLRKEHALKMQCILYESLSRGEVDYKLNSLMGNKDIVLEDFLPLEETVDNDDIAKSMKQLSNRERKVVSLRLDENMTIKEINIEIGSNRPSTSSDIYRRAIRKMQEDVNNERGE